MTIQSILLQFEPKRENVLQSIKAINREFGCFDIDAAKKVANYFELPVASVFSAASFYDEIKTKGKVALNIQICDGSNCNLKGADKIIKEVESYFGQKIDDTNNRKVSIERMSCMGNCLAGPVMIINGTVFEKVRPEKVDEILRSYMGSNY